MWQHVQDVLSILIPAVDSVRVFGQNLKISCILEVPHEHHRPRLILNLSVKANEDTPSFNSITNRWVHPESMQFWSTFPHILQEIWEIDPDNFPSWCQHWT